MNDINNIYNKIIKCIKILNFNINNKTFLDFINSISLEINLMTEILNSNEQTNKKFENLIKFLFTDEGFISKLFIFMYNNRNTLNEINNMQINKINKQQLTNFCKEIIIKRIELLENNEKFIYLKNKFKNNKTEQNYNKLIKFLCKFNKTNNNTNINDLIDFKFNNLSKNTIIYKIINKVFKCIFNKFYNNLYIDDDNNIIYNNLIKTTFNDYINKINYPSNEIKNIILLNEQYYEKITDNNIIISKQIGSTSLTEFELAVISLIVSTIDLIATLIEIIKQILEIMEFHYLFFVRLPVIIKLLDIVSLDIYTIITDLEYIDYYETIQ
jgi:hypothetical protein